MKGKLSNIVKDIRTNEYLVTFSTLDISDMEALEGVDLDIQVKKHRKKRSLDANSYFWVLCTKLANKLNTSKEEIYEEFLRRTGFIEEDTIIAIPDDKDISSYEGHWLYILTENGWSTYVKLIGSSEYDSYQMSVLIENIVDECKTQGIETLPPDELERMKNLWQGA